MLDSVYFYYFVVHAPITVLMDATFVIPRERQWAVQRALSDFHVTTNHDYLAASPPVWLQTFVWVELAYQLPLFLVAIVDYLRNKRMGYSKWLWTPLVVYGFNAGFTSLVCVAEILCNGQSHALTADQTWSLAGVYLPTTILPFVMMADYMSRISLRLNKTTKSKAI